MSSRSGFGRLALLGVLAAALAVAGCGRKGPLEAPPSANSVAAAPQQSLPSQGEPDHPGLEGERTQADPQTPNAARKSTPLDWLLK